MFLVVAACAKLYESENFVIVKVTDCYWSLLFAINLVIKLLVYLF
jgi:hypothetical protein